MTTMSDTKMETNKTNENSFSGLESEASILQKLAKALKDAAKSEAFGRPEFGKQIEEASRLAERINWPEVKATIAKHATTARERDEASLRTRREKLHHAASAAKAAAVMGTQFDRVDVFQIGYEGAVAVIRLGGIVVERSNELDGEKLFARVRQIREGFEKTAFDRETFFKTLKSGYEACRRLGADEFVPVRDLAREMVLERARNSERFRKSTDPKSIDPYSMPQFVFDLARFIRGGTAIKGERIVTQTPSMRESKETIHIPNLDNPTGNELAAAARLAIRPE